MAYLVRITPRAERDLEAIFDYIQADTSKAVYRWFNRLAEAIAGLSELPLRNPATVEDASLRQLLFGARPHVYRIIYAVDSAKKTVNILHVRHGFQDAFDTSDIQ